MYRRSFCCVDWKKNCWSQLRDDRPACEWEGSSFVYAKFFFLWVKQWKIARSSMKINAVVFAIRPTRSALESLFVSFEDQKTLSVQISSRFNRIYRKYLINQHAAVKQTLVRTRQITELYTILFCTHTTLLHYCNPIFALLALRCCTMHYCWCFFFLAVMASKQILLRFSNWIANVQWFI